MNLLEVLVEAHVVGLKTETWIWSPHLGSRTLGHGVGLGPIRSQTFYCWSQNKTWDGFHKELGLVLGDTQIEWIVPSLDE